jgi:lysophospholipase L1-like esterase
VLILVALLLLALSPPVRVGLYARLTSNRGQVATAKLAHVLLAGRYRFYNVDPAMIWNNGKQPGDAHETVDFLSSVVLSTDSPSLLLFARFDQFGPKDPPQFDISIDGGASKTVNWRTVLMPQRLSLGMTGEHTIVIRANPLLYNGIGIPFPLRQNVITGFAVPAKFRISVKPEPVRRQILVTVTDSIGQGNGTPDPAHDAWPARLADSGRWPGAVMNRGFIGARLADFCHSTTTCAAFAGNLDRDYPNATAYYFALGTNDFGLWHYCIPPSLFAESLSSLLQNLHRSNPGAALYLQTPIHRADEAQPNSCGNTLSEFRDAGQRMAQTLPWITLIDGFSQPFPQTTPGGAGFVDGVHPTAQGQEQYFHAVIQSLHLGT